MDRALGRNHGAHGGGQRGLGNGMNSLPINKRRDFNDHILRQIGNVALIWHIDRADARRLVERDGLREGNTVFVRALQLFAIQAEAVFIIRFILECNNRCKGA